MAGKLTLETLSLEQVLQGRVQGDWDNPDRLALLTPEKHRALASNPFATDPVLPAQIVAFFDGRVIGSIDMIQGRVTHQEVPYTILWGSNLFVHPDYRHVAAGIALLMQMQRSYSVVGVVGVSKMVHGVYQGLKWAETQMPRMVLPFKSKSLAQAVLRNEGLGRVASSFVDPVLTLMRWRIANETESRLAGFTVERAVAADPLIQRVYPHRESLGPLRNTKGLDWLMHNSFDSDTSRAVRLITVKDPEDRPVAYALLRLKFHAEASQMGIKNLRLATVSDWQVDPECGLTEEDVVLLGALETRLMGADAVEIPTNDRALRVALSRFGFRQAGELNVFFKAAKGSDLAGLHFTEDSGLRPADGDNFFA